MSFLELVLVGVYGLGLGCMVLAQVLAPRCRDRSWARVVGGGVFCVVWPLFALSIPLGMLSEALGERKAWRARGGKA